MEREGKKETARMKKEKIYWCGREWKDGRRGRKERGWKLVMGWKGEKLSGREV